MLATMNEVLKIAEEKRIAVGSFNVPTLENIMAVIAVAEKLQVPVMLMHAQLHEEIVPMEVIAPIMLMMAKNAKVPVAVHLDHCDDLDYLQRALELGFTSVMFDGSLLSYEENVNKTKIAVEKAKHYGANVEAEIGILGGREAGAKEMSKKVEDMYTDPVLAKQFVEETGIDALAASFGTAHGFYSVAPNLDFVRIKKIQSMINIPLVMHGGSGVSPSDYLKAIDCGIRKINYYSYMGKAGVIGIKEYLEQFNGEVSFYHELANAAIKKMEQNVEAAIKVFSKQ